MRLDILEICNDTSGILDLLPVSLVEVFVSGILK